MPETATAAMSKARRYWLRSTWLPRLGSRLASRSCCRRVYLSSASIICREMSIGGVGGTVRPAPLSAGGGAGGGGGRAQHGGGARPPAAEQGYRVLAGVFAGFLFARGVKKAGDEPDRPAIDPVADDTRQSADRVAGDPAVKRADDRQMLQRIDDVDEVAKAEGVTLPRAFPRGVVRLAGGRREEVVGPALRLL